MNSAPGVLFLRAVVPAVLTVVLAMPATGLTQAASKTANPADQDHIVPSQALQRQMQSVGTDRQNNIDFMNGFLSTPQVQRAMRDSHIDAERVRSAVPTLTDQELADVTARASNIQQQFAGGFVGPGLLTLIIILVIVIIIVAAVH